MTSFYSLNIGNMVKVAVFCALDKPAKTTKKLFRSLGLHEKNIEYINIGLQGKCVADTLSINDFKSVRKCLSYRKVDYIVYEFCPLHKVTNFTNEYFSLFSKILKKNGAFILGGWFPPNTATPMSITINGIYDKYHTTDLFRKNPTDYMFLFQQQHHIPMIFQGNPIVEDFVIAKLVKTN